MQLCHTKSSVILEIDPYVISIDLFNERSIAATSNFQSISAKNDSLLQIDEIVTINANSMYLDRNVLWVLIILAEYMIVSITKFVEGTRHVISNFAEIANLIKLNYTCSIPYRVVARLKVIMTCFIDSVNKMNDFDGQIP